MVRSMTGYGKDVIHKGDTTVTIEVRSVNHRFLDVAVKLPRTILFLEDKIKKVMRTYVQRGHVDIYIQIDGDGMIQKELKTDWNMLAQYMEHFDRAKQQYDLEGTIPASVMTMIPDLMTVQEVEMETDAISEIVLTGVHHACERMVDMRTKEGEFLFHDLQNRSNVIEETVHHLQSLRETVTMEYHDRIQERLQYYIEDNKVVDRARMHQEIALLAEKGDISEETTRLMSHVSHFLEITYQQEAMGRKLDFIIQEMHREANTIGSKSTDPKIGKQIVSLKSNIEKMKEQVQNIE
ncbi:YicC family protein [Virgibacillus siamensis]|uniref:YicC family protein n=1 Tax=Virgibacillus siamensis TaxID=480071 RepID=A0ABN1GJB6_9BACI